MPSLRPLLPLLLAVTAVSCSGGGSGGGSGNGSLTLAVTDAPVDGADAVSVTFVAITVKPVSGESITIDLDTPRTLDLLSLSGTRSENLLGDENLAAGRYEWLRLDLDEALSAITVAGQQYPLTIPGSARTGLKLNRGFTIAEGAQTSFTVDFDLRKSVHRTGNGAYIMRPTLRIVDTLAAGSIAGSVSATLVGNTQTCFSESGDVQAFVYVYAGSDTEPHDVNIDGQGDGPVSTARVTLDGSGNYVYTAGFLEPADYTVALSCDAASDDPDRSDTLTYLISGSATVSAAQTTVFDFGV
jgi:hypothetical protein